MNQQNKKMCIQKRIVSWLSGRSPEFLFFVSLFVFIIALLVLENSRYSYSSFLDKLKYDPQIKDLVTLIVMTDGFIIAFTGVIASMILKQVFEEEKKRPRSLYGFVGDKRFEFEPNYGKRRHEIIKFVFFILITLVSSIWLSLTVIITQNFLLSMGSVIGLFIGLIELVGLIYYSLKI